jgi:hypothetical protein
MEKVAVRAPSFQRRLHRRRRYGEIEEAHRRLVGLKFSRHEAWFYQLSSHTHPRALCA